MKLRRGKSAALVYLVALGLAVAAAGCASSSGKPSTAATVTVTQVRPQAQPSTPTPSTSRPSSPPPAPPASTPAPSAVVTAYFNAINAGNYQEAWNLGGSNLSSSYAQFVSGFAGTADDAVTILSTSGNTVEVDLVATQSDGSEQHFTGTYTVSGSTITSASVSQVGGAPAQNANTCGAPANPYGYTLCPGGSLIHSPAAGVCGYFHCIENFGNGHGYMVECADSTYSMSGGIDGACSDHGGEKQPVYSG